MPATDPFSNRTVGTAYDTTVDRYVVDFGDDLVRLPVDRAMLDAALARAQETGGGPVVEAGCGPGPAASHYEPTVSFVAGVDVARAMLVEARRRSPTLRPVRGDLRALPLATGTVGLVTAWYCLQHVGRGEVPGALAEVVRVLRPGGVLALAVHLGEGEVVIEDFLGHRVAEPVGGTFFGADEMLGLIAAAGLRVVEERTRGPLAHEHDSSRLYLIATRP